MNGKQTAIVFVVVTIVLCMVSECSRRHADQYAPAISPMEKEIFR